ncbi:MAG: alpha/beta fold hydrolase [Bacteroidales bacterium]|nr:alpha/beta fold hydrolase [Bacteroidales bacterium]
MKLYYRKYGDSGTPLIIVHGLYGSSDNWITIARDLSNDFEVFAVDQRNHGDSPKDKVHDYAALVSDLKEFMDRENIEKAILLGHSMGGKTVMYFSLKYPERVESLVVIDIAPIAYHDLAEHSRMTANHAKMIDAMMEVDLSKMSSREEVSRTLAVNIGSERIRMFLLKNLTRNKQKQFAWKINLPALKENLDRIMDELPVDDVIKNGGISGFPVFFIGGEKSDYIQPEHHDVIKKIFPSAEITSLPNTGHWLHAEKPELLIKNLRYFLT